MKKGIFERCLSTDANETMRKVSEELNLLEADILRAVTDNGLATQMDDVALLLLLEPLVADLRRRVSKNPRATLLFNLMQTKIKVMVTSTKDGDRHV